MLVNVVASVAFSTVDFNTDISISLIYSCTTSVTVGSVYPVGSCESAKLTTVPLCTIAIFYFFTFTVRALHICLQKGVCVPVSGLVYHPPLLLNTFVPIPLLKRLISSMV